MSERRGGEGRSIFDRLSGKEGDKAKEGSSRQKGSDKNEARQDEENAGPIKCTLAFSLLSRFSSSFHPLPFADTLSLSQYILKIVSIIYFVLSLSPSVDGANSIVVVGFSRHFVFVYPFPSVAVSRHLVVLKK